MFLTEIYLKNFRSYREVMVTTPPGLILLTGPNGAGKTNVLEAVFFAGVCRSFRAAADRDLVHAGASRFVIRVTATGAAGNQQFEVTYDRARGKRAALNGVPVTRLLDYVGVLPVVAFAAEDLALTRDEPAARRRFLDIWLSQERREYLELLQRYVTALRNRNVLLNRRAPRQEREPFEHELIAAGTQITVRRAKAVATLAPLAASAYAEIADGERLEIFYQPSAAPQPAEDPTAVAAAFREKLMAATAEDEKRGLTTVGPHRDDLALTVAGADVRRFASKGQQRTAAVALRLAQFRLLASRRGEKPLALLDDVAADLDPGRHRRLLNALAAAEQIWLAAAAPPTDLKPAIKFNIKPGEILPETA